MTVVEGRVPKEKIASFQAMYASAKNQAKPPGLKMSMLLQDTADEGLFRVSTLWQDRESLEEMRRNTKVAVCS